MAEEVQGEGAFDQGAVDFLGPVPFEVSHGFEAAETGLSEAAFEAAAGEIGGLGAGDFFQQLVGAPALGGRPGQEIIQALGGDEQAQIFQLRGQVILRRRGLGRVHRKPPERDLRPSSFPGRDGARD